eukprot:m.25892 g.25892  ORF g.25892 m.25892 type:complete len:303 (-) comp6246_c0_seq1:22-930(-)
MPRGGGTETGHAAVAGAVSGAVTRALLQPLDVLKIRMQLSCVPAGATPPSLLGTVTNMVRYEGIGALWKGHAPAQLLSVMYGAIGFAAYAEACRAIGVDSQQKSKGAIFSAHFLAGGLAGLMATLACHPLDTLRTLTVADRTRGGLVSVVRENLAAGAGRALYKGVTPSLLLIFPYSGLQFGYYRVIQRTLDTVAWVVPAEAARSLIAGAGAGLLGKLNVLPLDLLKKRLQMQGVSSFPQYAGLRDCVRVILKTEGLRAFFRGAGPATLKAALTSASIFVVYEHTLTLLNTQFGGDPPVSVT